MTSPASDESPRLDLKPVADMFQRVENVMKTVEKVSGKFPAPVLNQLPYGNRKSSFFSNARGCLQPF